MKSLLIILMLIAAIKSFGDETVTQDNFAVVGKKTSSSNKGFKVYKGSGNTKASVRFNTGTQKWQTSPDDTTFTDIPSSSSSTDIGSQSSAAPNLLSNGGFELGTVNWASTGSFSVTTTAANVGFGLQSASFTATAPNQTLTSDQVTVPAGLYGSVCLAEVYYLGGDSGMQLQAIDGTLAVLGTVSLPATATYAVANVAFTCPSSGTIALQVKSTLSIGAQTNLDKAYLGENYYRKRDWIIDANIFGANIGLSKGFLANFTNISAPGTSLEINTAKGSLTNIQIPCDASNPSTGTTCAAGNPDVGIVYNLPGPQKVDVCIAFSHTPYLENQNGNFESVFQLIETSNTDSSPGSFVQEGGSRIQSEIGAPVTNNEQSFPHYQCDVFNHLTGGKKTIRLMYAQNLSVSPAGNTIRADRTVGKRDIHITVRPH